MSKEDNDIKELAQSYSKDMLKVLKKLVLDHKTPATARVTAAIAVLDRGFGKPGQQIDLNSTENEAFKLAQMARLAQLSDQELDKQIERLESGKQSPDPPGTVGGDGEPESIQ